MISGIFHLNNSKLIRNKDDQILKCLSVLKNKRLSRNSERGKVIVKKFRYVDPEIIFKDGIKKLTQISSQYRNFLERQKRINKKGIKVSLKF